MLFTAIYVLVTLLVLAVLLGVTYKMKGVKAAFISGVAFLLLAVLLATAIAVIVNTM